MKPTFELHKLSEGFIITSDEHWKVGDTLYDFKDGVFRICKIEIKDEWCKKIIALQDQIDFSALSEEEQKEIGWFDVEKLAYKDIEDNFGTNIILTESGLKWIEAFQVGFQKAQELLSDRRFTLEEMKKAVDIALNSSYVSTQHFSGHSTVKHNFTSNEIIQSLSQPKSWKVEIEMDVNTEGQNGLDRAKLIPKLTNGKIKILRIL